MPTMTRALLLCAAAATALTLAGCNRKEAATNEANPGQTGPVNAAQDAAGAAVGAVSASTLGANDTDAFVSNASQSDMYEIKAGQMAQQKGQSKAVKDFGKMMVTEHTAMTNELKPLIAAAGKQPAADLDQRRKGLLDNLTAATGGDFDKVYLAQQEAAHNEALTLMRGYSESGPDAGLKAAAAKAVPKVQAHLDKVKQLQSAPAGAAPAKK
jgi:putative membrane protein